MGGVGRVLAVDLEWATRKGKLPPHPVRSGPLTPAPRVQPVHSSWQFGLLMAPVRPSMEAEVAPRRLHDSRRQLCSNESANSAAKEQQKESNQGEAHARSGPRVHGAVRNGVPRCMGLYIVHPVTTYRIVAGSSAEFGVLSLPGATRRAPGPSNPSTLPGGRRNEWRAPYSVSTGIPWCLVEIPPIAHCCYASLTSHLRISTDRVSTVTTAAELEHSTQRLPGPVHITVSGTHERNNQTRLRVANSQHTV